MPVEHDVVRRDVVNDRRTRLCRGLWIDYGRENAVVDHDLFRGVLGLRIALGNDNSHFVTDVAYLAIGQRRTRAGFHRRAVLGMNGPATDMSADFVGCDVGAGEDRNHARQASGRFDVDRFYGRVGVRRADEISVGLARPVDVVGVMTLAGNEAVIFLPAHRRADPGCCHCGFLPRLYFGRVFPLELLLYSAAFLAALLPMARAPAAIALTIL